jgi:hypothetical protein
MTAISPRSRSRRKPSALSSPARSWSRSAWMLPSAIRSPGLAVATEGFRRIGAAIARLPTVLVQEGGYLSDILGTNLTAVLAGFQSAR